MTGFEFDTATGPGTNRAVAPTRCATCHGDRFVVVRLRSPEQTLWMNEHGITCPPDRFHEEVAPCPDCHHVEVSYYRHDSSRFRVMDPAAVRDTLAR